MSLAKGEVALYSGAYNAALEDLRLVLETGGIEITNGAVLRKAARECIRTYLKSLKAERKMRTELHQNRHPDTTALAQMEIGERRVFDATRNTIYQRLRSARRLAQDETARWLLKSLPSGRTEVERIAAGHERPWNWRRNAKALWLSELEPGESKVATPELFGTQVHHTSKHAARMILNDMEATWSAYRVTTAKGLAWKVTRTR